jgi:hypothetical protein
MATWNPYAFDYSKIMSSIQDYNRQAAAMNNQAALSQMDQTINRLSSPDNLSSAISPMFSAPAQAANIPTPQYSSIPVSQASEFSADPGLVSVPKNPQLTSQQKGDIATAAITGGLQFASDLGNIAGQRFDFGKLPTQAYSPDVAPSYQLGEYFNKVYAARPKGASAGEVLGTAGKMAATGAQIGTAIMPGIGTAIGALGGAVMGTQGALIAGAIKKRRQTREREKALGKLTKAQQEYNTAAQEFSQAQMARQDYLRRSDPYRRMRNLYAI